jgi:hypothetical protein
MAYNVKFTVPSRDLGHADIKFDVNSRNGKLGTAKISKDSLVWVPKDHTYGYKLAWSDFAELMQHNGANEQRLR